MTFRIPAGVLAQRLEVSRCKMLREMAVSRKDWKKNVKADLMGAFGEYMCAQVALAVGVHNAWDKEIKLLVKTVNNNFSHNLTFKDTKKAFKEVTQECSPGSKVGYALRKLADYYPARHIEILDLDFDPEIEFRVFIARHISGVT